MTSNNEPLQSHEDSLTITSQSSSSGTTGLSSYNITNGYNDLDMEDGRDETRPGSGVDQGVDLMDTPRALHTVGGGLPRTGYEPKPSSTKVVDGEQKPNEDQEYTFTNTASTTPVHCAGGNAGNPFTSTASTTPVLCAGGSAGKGKRERRQAEPWSVRLGQSDSSGYGPEICELEEKNKILPLKKKGAWKHCMRNY